MAIPFVDLKAQYLSIKDEIDSAIQNVIDNAHFIMGPDVKEFEKEFAGFCGAAHAIGVSSGTSALHLALMSCGVGQGDEVITVPNTFMATAEAITHVGAKPVFVDVEEDSCNIDPYLLESAVTDKTKAITAVHLFGQPADMDAVNEVAQRYDLAVIEDAAQAHGAEYKGNEVGTLGKVACFSFYPGKNLGAYGDAGMVVTDEEEIAEKVILLRNHGRVEKYLHLVEGHNYRMDTIQAAVLRVKLRYLREWTDKRRNNARLYDRLLEDSRVMTPKEMDYAKHVYHLYVIRTEKRDELQDILKESGIATGRHYPVPLHLQPAYKYLGYEEGDFPVTEELAREGLSLPMFAELTEEEIARIAQTVRSNVWM